MMPLREPRELRLPQRLDLQSFQQFEESWRWDEDAEVTCCSSGPIAHVEPVWLAALAAWAQHRRERGRSTIIDHSLQSPYAWHSGLLTALARAPSQQSRMHVLTRWITKPSEVSDALRAFGALDIEEDPLDAVKHITSELVRNVFEHAGASGAALSVAHFKNANRVTICVADCGQGIATHLRQRPEFHGVTDEQALAFAAEPHVSGAQPDTYGVMNNAGLGLARSREIAQRSEGRFFIKSEGGVLIALRHGQPFDVVLAANAWRGAVVAVSIKPSMIASFSGVSEEVNEALHPSHDSLVRFEKEPSTDENTIHVHADIGNMAQDKTWAITTARDTLRPLLDTTTRDVHIEMSGVRMTTQSFVHALLFGAISSHGPELARRIVVHRASLQVRSIVSLVVAYALETYDERSER